MAKTDFFDDDLIQREGASSVGRGAEADAPGAGNPSDALPARPVGDFNLTRMARHREEVESQVARTAEELERLRQRQEDLERERRSLQELRSRQDEFEQGRADLMERIAQSMLALERDEVRAEQNAEILGSTRQRFRGILTELEQMNPETWPDEKIRDELGKALTIVEDARLEFKKSISRIEALHEQAGEREDAGARHYDRPLLTDMHGEYGFGHWIKIGFAFSLPLILTALIIALTTLALFFRGY